ncbi:MAG: phosphatidate cytidylyltransferase [Lachnospiraceae bacterium]|nr:phosphatidate cytidylyltransferase [Lachnospiraceae bacterium]
MSNKDSIQKDNSFLIRLRTGAILVVIAVAAIVLGGYVLWGLLLAVSMIGLMELYRAVGVHKSPAAFAGYAAGAAWYGILLWKELLSEDGAFPYTVIFPVLIAAFIIVLLAVYVFSFPKYNSEQITMIFFGFFYVALTLSYIFLVRGLQGGKYTVWLIFIGSWGADTMAYLVGRTIGKHKIVPVLSPKKSLEGFIGGVLGAVLIGVIYALIFKNSLTEEFPNPVFSFAVIAACASVVSMIGDLAASAIKRDKQIKDYGKLLPGHGGILDRFDSVIFIAPIVYYLLYFGI